MARRTAPTMKIAILCSETHMSWGTAVTIPAKVAPIPNTTKSAGSAQHVSVPREVKRLRKAVSFLTLSPRDRFYCVPGFFEDAFNFLVRYIFSIL